MNNLLTRSITGLVFITSVLFSLYFDPIIAAALFSFFTYIGTQEYLKTTWKKDATSPVIVIYALVAATLVFCTGFAGVSKLIFIWACVIPFILSAEILRSNSFDWDKAIHAIVPFFWLALPFSIFIALVWDPNFSFKHSVAILVGVWSNDSFAYITGRIFGKRKFAPRISPNKTWEGVVGGVLFSGAAMHLIFPDAPILHAGIIGILVGLASTVGDLVESFWKRTMDIKDSGEIFPGHGGVLDRFDGFVFAAPFAVLLFYLFAL